MSVDYSRYKALKFERPRPRLLEVIISNPGKLNALGADGHREMAEIWRDVDRDESVDVVLLRGEGGVTSAGGDLDMVHAMHKDWNARIRGWKEANDIVYNALNCSKLVVAAIEKVVVGAGLASLALEFLGFSGPELEEGRKALVEKRRPDFKNTPPY